MYLYCHLSGPSGAITFAREPRRCQWAVQTVRGPKTLPERFSDSDDARDTPDSVQFGHAWGLSEPFELHDAFHLVVAVFEGRADGVGRCNRRHEVRQEPVGHLIERLDGALEVFDV